MKRYLFVWLALLLAACTAVPEKDDATVLAPTTVERVTGVTATVPDTTLKGQNAAVQLTNWYNRTEANCGTAARPAFLCSGVMLRGTVSMQSYLPWDPSPGSVTSGGVSFAWIRTDTNFKQLPLNYNNGYTFYPVLDTPAGKNSDIAVLCSFPFDGWTDVRPQQGCGASPDFPTESRPCNDQGVNTAQQWLNHFNRASNKYLGQCGWNVREGQANTADRFYQSMLSRNLLTGTHWNSNNELRLATWRTGTGAALPIQSFFYVANTAGLAAAQDDQRRYYQNYQQVVPVIRLTFAADKNQKAKFEFRADDQVIGDIPGDKIDFESVPLQEGKREIVLPGANARFYVWGVPEDEPFLAVRDRTPAQRNISGHYLYTGHQFSSPIESFIFEPSAPVSEISFDLEFVQRIEPGSAGEAYLTDGTEIRVDFQNRWYGHVNYVAPQGKKITRVRIHNPPSGTAVDNILVKE
ncbi:hypothetical protein [Pseudomonas sp. UM16]|uniref:hypothetical protein n=1 Tax=Pseudomonas sp. UM16 TaxID=3158962 RepID=UPI003990250C